MRLKYIGQKPTPLSFDTPIPYLSRAEHIGQIVFDPECEVQDDWATYLLTNCPDVFVRVGSEEELAAAELKKQAGVLEILEKSLGKVFKGKTGKWQALAYIKKHQLLEYVQLAKTPYGWKIIDRPEQSAGLDVPITVSTEGQEVSYDDRDRIEQD